MKNYIKQFCYISIVLIFIGCSEDRHSQSTAFRIDSENAISATNLMASKPQSTTIPQKSTMMNRKIIKEGNIIFESVDMGKTRNLIDQMTEEFSGYISRENQYYDDDKIRQFIEIEIPAQNFDSLLSKISKSVKKFDEKNITTKDITEEYLDIEARIKTKKQIENRYRQLLTQAKVVKDILAIEKEIEKLRADIESIEGRFKYLQHQVAYSTLKVTFYKTISTTTGFYSQVTSGLKNGWNGILVTVIALIHLWPLILILLLGSLIIYKKRSISQKRS